MSLVNLFTKTAPTIASWAFDAVLEDTLEVAVEVTTYPIESGVRVGTHRILLPFKYTLTGAISNNPLKAGITDFVGGAVSNLTDNPYVAAVAGLSASFLAGTDETRGSATLEFLIDLTRQGEPFSIDAGDITLKNMVITKLSRTKEPRNENGLEFVAELQEMITLDRVASFGQPSQEELPNDDPAKSALARTIEKGQRVGKEVGAAVRDKVNNILDGVF